MKAVEAAARVLLVEDDEGLAELIADYLGRNGLEMHWIRRGDAAIEKTHELEPDLLLLDVMLPGLDGFEICRELRARGATLPIMILTARDEDFDRVVGLELGADEFIPKPVQPRVLLAHVRAILRRAGMRERHAASCDTIVFGALEIDIASRAVRLGGGRSTSPARSSTCSGSSRATPARCCRATTSSTSCAASTTTAPTVPSTAASTACGASWATSPTAPSASRRSATWATSSARPAGSRGAPP